MKYENVITVGAIYDLLTLIKARTGDPSIIATLRSDKSGVIESGATKEIYAVWLDTAEFYDILNANIYTNREENARLNRSDE